MIALIDEIRRQNLSYFTLYKVGSFLISFLLISSINKILRLNKI